MEENRKRTGLIRLAGLAAMTSGLAATTMGLAAWLSEPPYSQTIPYLDSARNATIQTLVNVSDVFVIAGALVAIAALHNLHGGFYDTTGTVVSLVVFVGIALLLVLALGDVLRWTPWFSMSPAGGYALAALGGIGFGVVTMARRVVPWWCGIALIVGTSGLSFAGLLGELFAAMAGAAWALVGFAVFRAGTRQSQQPLRVR